MASGKRMRIPANKEFMNCDWGQTETGQKSFIFSSRSIWVYYRIFLLQRFSKFFPFFKNKSNGYTFYAKK